MIPITLTKGNDVTWECYQPESSRGKYFRFLSGRGHRRGVKLEGNDQKTNQTGRQTEKGLQNGGQQSAHRSHYLKFFFRFSLSLSLIHTLHFFT